MSAHPQPGSGSVSPVPGSSLERAPLYDRQTGAATYWPGLSGPRR